VIEEGKPAPDFELQTDGVKWTRTTYTSCPNMCGSALERMKVGPEISVGANRSLQLSGYSPVPPLQRPSVPGAPLGSP
jgi:hypothetical protein